MKVSVFSLFMFLVFFSFAQKPLAYSFNLPIEIQKKRNFEKRSTEWLQKQNAHITKIDKDTIWAVGSINFNNTVVYSKSRTFNRIYREQSNGKIAFNIKLYVEKKQLTVALNQFKHQPKMKFDNLNFGLITDGPNPPKETINMTNQAYSTKVWELMKENIGNYTNSINDSSNNMVSK